MVVELISSIIILAASGAIFSIVVIVVIGTSIWVYFDATSLGIKKEFSSAKSSGLANMGPGGWFVSCLGIWIIAFPLYLVKRDEFKRMSQIGDLNAPRFISRESDESRAESTEQKQRNFTAFLIIVVGIGAVIAIGAGAVNMFDVIRSTRWRTSSNTHEVTYNLEKEILKAICVDGNVKEVVDPKEHSLVGNYVCSKGVTFTDYEAGVDATIADITLGSFTAGGSKEAVVDLIGTESVANGFGGSVLLRYGKSKWEMLKYYPGMRTANSQKYPMRDGREMLICQPDPEPVHGFVGGYLHIATFTPAGEVLESNVQEFLPFIYDNTGECSLASGSMNRLSRYAVIGFRFGQIRFNDVNNDGNKDMQVDMSYAFVDVDAKLEGVEYDGCLTAQETAKLVPLKKELVYLSTGDDFEPTDDTKEFIVSLKNRIPPGFVAKVLAGAKKEAVERDISQKKRDDENKQ